LFIGVYVLPGSLVVCCVLLIYVLNNNVGNISDSLVPYCLFFSSSRYGV